MPRYGRQTLPDAPERGTGTHGVTEGSLVSEHVVVLDPGRPLGFTEDACATLAAQIREMPDGAPASEELSVVDGEVVGASARLLREELSRMPKTSPAWLRIVDHLLERLRQVRSRECTIEVAEIADQIHGRLCEATAPIV